MTTIIIFAFIIAIAVVDILLGVYKKKYITDIFRSWYKTRPFAPYCVGVLVLGHFQELIELSNIPFFIITSVLYLVYCLIMGYTNVRFGRKFFMLQQKWFPIPMLFGAIVGIFWRT